MGPQVQLGVVELVVELQLVALEVVELQSVALEVVELMVELQSVAMEVVELQSVALEVVELVVELQLLALIAAEARQQAVLLPVVVLPCSGQCLCSLVVVLPGGYAGYIPCFLGSWDLNLRCPDSPPNCYNDNFMIVTCCSCLEKIHRETCRVLVLYFTFTNM